MKTDARRGKAESLAIFFSRGFFFCFFHGNGRSYYLWEEMAEIERNALGGFYSVLRECFARESDCVVLWASTGLQNIVYRWNLLVREDGY